MAMDTVKHFTRWCNMSEYLNDRTVDKILNAGAETFKDRHRLYGDNYKRFGNILTHLFPNGVDVTNPDIANKLNLLIQITGKVTRYAEGLSNGNKGHKDSAHDIMVYAAMLEELTDE